MEGSGSNIKSSMKRGGKCSHTVVDGFKPQNGHSGLLKNDPSGKDTNRIIKSSTDEQAGPITNNL